MRLFAAAELTDGIRHDLAAVRDSVVAVDQAWAGEKWVAPENLHITLRFFGEVPDDDVDRVVAVVGEAVADLTVPIFSGVRLVATPNPRRTAMIWAEWNDTTGAGASAVRAIAAALPEYSPDAEKPFRAHVTLCRARRPQRLAPESLASAFDRLSCADVSMSVLAVSVISSRLTPRGPVYATIGTRLFGGR